MTAVIETNPGQLSVLQAMLHGSAAFSSIDEINLHIRNTPSEFAVVIGPSISDSDASELAQWARVHRPDLGVILLRHGVDSAALGLALRSGMREVVDARDLAGITTAVQRARSVANAIGQTMLGEAHAAVEAAKAEVVAEAAAAQAAADAPQGKTYTVFSTKGGVGKSTVATNLSVALADAGTKVCLVDLDVNSGDVAIMLQLNPSRTLSDLSAFNGVIDEGAVEAILTKYSDNLSIVAAPVRLDSPDQATADDIAKLLDALKSRFEVIVIDTSGVFDDNALTALDRSDRIILVGTLDIPALKGLKLAASTLDLLNYPRESWTFVLNRADSRVGLSSEEFESTLGLRADCSLVSSREVLSAVNRGETFVRAHPGHANSKAMVTFSRSFVPSNSTAGSPSGRKSSGSRLRLRKS